MVYKVAGHAMFELSLWTVQWGPEGLLEAKCLGPVYHALAVRVGSCLYSASLESHIIFKSQSEFKHTVLDNHNRVTNSLTFWEHFLM